MNYVKCETVLENAIHLINPTIQIHSGTAGHYKSKRYVRFYLLVLDLSIHFAYAFANQTDLKSEVSTSLIEVLQNFIRSTFHLYMNLSTFETQGFDFKKL